MDSFEEQQNQKSSGLRSTAAFIWDFLKVIIVALAIILPIRYFVFQPFIVSGSSMEPNYSNGEYLIIDEISYRFGTPARGDVMVVRYPKDPKQFFIKRVIGLPGEKIEIDNGRIKIYNDEYPKGVTLQEPYLSNQGLSFPHNTTIIGGRKSVTLSAEQYFMMGDNRLASSDSRDWGPLPTEDIVGKVFIRVLPLTEFGLFERPDYSL